MKTTIVFFRGVKLEVDKIYYDYPYCRKGREGKNYKYKGPYRYKSVAQKRKDDIGYALKEAYGYNLGKYKVGHRCRSYHKASVDLYEAYIYKKKQSEKEIVT